MSENAPNNNPIPKEVEKLKDELIWVRHAYNQYLKLYVGNPDRISLLNETAPHFFRDLQRMMWHYMIVVVSRLTDEHQQGRYRNLTIKILPVLAERYKWEFKDKLSSKVNQAVEKSMGIRKWRMKYVAHRDYDVAMEDNKTMGKLTLEMVDEALSAIGKAINLVYANLKDTTWSWDLIEIQNVDDLIYHLKLASIYKESFGEAVEDLRRQDEEMMNSKFRDA